MNEIFVNYVAAFAKPNLRAFAHVHALNTLSKYEGQLDTNQIKLLLSYLSSFADQYTKAWPWQKEKVISETIKNFNISIQNVIDKTGKN